MYNLTISQKNINYIAFFGNIVILLFKISISSLLWFTVSKKCGNTFCSIEESFAKMDNYEAFIVGLNVFTFLMCLKFYTYDILKEYMIISYGNSNNDYVMINSDIYNNFQSFLDNYKIVCNMCIFFVMANISFTGIGIFMKYNFELFTFISFSSNFLLIIDKIFDSADFDKIVKNTYSFPLESVDDYE